jgi:8-amino-3,8-dideoxy-alpha-D-manno-octulosonate transaminase
LLPTEEITRAVVTELRSQNILAGNFYWYDNNWHYIRKWDHLKQGITLSALSPDHKTAVMHHANKKFTASDAIMSRCISTAISLLWTEDQLKEKGERIVSVCKEVMRTMKLGSV